MQAFVIVIIEDKLVLMCGFVRLHEAEMRYVVMFASPGEECETVSEAAAAVHPDHFYTP